MTKLQIWQINIAEAGHFLTLHWLCTLDPALYHSLSDMWHDFWDNTCRSVNSCDLLISRRAISTFLSQVCHRVINPLTHAKNANLWLGIHCYSSAWNRIPKTFFSSRKEKTTSLSSKFRCNQITWWNTSKLGFNLFKGHFLRTKTLIQSHPVMLKSHCL